MNATWKLVAVLAPVIAAGAVARPAAVTPDATAVPTFTRDVAPILQDKCQACHRDGYIAPMSLVTYEQTRPWARSIKARVADV